MNDLEKKAEIEAKNIESFAKNLKNDLFDIGEKNEKTANFDQTDKDDSDFSLTVSDCLDLIGEDNLAAFLNLPEKISSEFALKVIPKEDRNKFKYDAKDNKHFAGLKVRLTKKLIEKYGGNLNAKVSPEIALLCIMAVSCTLVYIQTKSAVDAYLFDLQTLKSAA